MLRRSTRRKVHLLEKERAWFHRQPAFKQARAHVLERFREDAHGNYYNPDELEAGVRVAKVARASAVASPRPQPAPSALPPSPHRGLRRLPPR